MFMIWDFPSNGEVTYVLLTLTAGWRVSRSCLSTGRNAVWPRNVRSFALLARDSQRSRVVLLTYGCHLSRQEMNATFISKEMGIILLIPVTNSPPIAAT